MRVLQLLLLGLFFSAIGQAQVWTGRVLDAETREPLSYVNVGVVNQGIGTVSDENGNFRLDLSQAKDRDRIRISFIGYEDLEMAKSECMKLPRTDDYYLNKRSYDLSAVVVRPQKVIQRVLGNKTRSRSMHVGFDENLLGHELGVIMKTRGKGTWLDSIKINVSQCGYDSIFFRVNVYEFNGDFPDKNILKTPVYLSLAKRDVSGTITVDLTDIFIYTENDFLVSLELVKDLGSGNLYFSTGFLLAPIYYRYTSQDRWKKFPFGAGISAYVSQNK